MDRGKENEMEGIAPTLKCLLEMETAIQNGTSTRSAIVNYLEHNRRTDDCVRDLADFFFCWEQALDWKSLLRKLKSPQRRALFELLASGLSGQSILSPLVELRKEVAEVCEMEIREKIELLPIQMLIPLLLFQFPAFLILIFGPLLSKLIEEINK